MKKITLKTIATFDPPLRNSLSSATAGPFAAAGLLIPLLIACFAISPMAKAVVPAPDGGYPGQNTAEGESALLHLAGGTYNTALGWASLGFNVTGNYNTGVGAATLLNNTADNNTATGAGALLSNTVGESNTANGAFALFSNTIGFGNTAVGRNALHDNTSGRGHTAVGYSALKKTNASDDFTGNTAVGSFALFNDTTGNSNVAVGWGAGLSLTTGSRNTAIGSTALLRNTTGRYNTATGVDALSNNITGQENTANGFQALFNTTGSGFNVAIGSSALYNNTTGSFNTALGVAAGFGVQTAHSVICIDAAGANVSNTTWIGHIYNTATVSATTLPVVVSNTNQLGTMSSSARFKKEIKPMDKASGSILALKPVTFHYKSDSTGTPQFGLIAEEVAEVNPDLVVRDENGEIYTVRYEAVNAMLLNEFLKEHRKNEDQGATITALKAIDAKQEATITQQQKQIDALTGGLQKVSAQVEVSKFATGRIRRGGPESRLANH
jgi:hypothetical protein